MEFKDFIKEEKEKHAVLAFGRVNPPTIGHEKLVNKTKEVAQEVGGTHHVVLSHSQDSAKNPLTSQQKLKHAKRFFPDTNLSVSTKEHPNFLSHAAKLHKAGATHLHMVAGSDRIPEYEKTLHKYNGVKGPHGHFNFKKITMHSAGERDPDAEGAEGMSASKMRGHASGGNFGEFRKGIPSHVPEKHAKELYHDVRKGMSIKERVELNLSLDYLFEQQLDEGVHDKSIFKAVFLAGGPGSGKDYVLDNTLSGHGLTEINSDKAFEYLMDKENLDMKMPKSEQESRDLVRGRAKSVTELRQKLALMGRNGLIINGTGDDLDKVKKIKKRLEEIGYDTSMIMVNTRDEVSQQRNIDRGQRGGRTVPEDIRREKYDSVQKNRTEFAKLFGQNYIEFDNSEDMRSADPEIIRTKKKEIQEIFKKIKEFTSKQPDHEQAQQWIATELNKKDTVKPSEKGLKQTAPHGSAASEEAKKLGLQYYGFGRYGKNGTTTHHSINDKLVAVGKIKLKTPNIPTSGSSMSSSKSKSGGHGTKIPPKAKEKLEKIRASSKLPKDKKEEYDVEFEELLNETVTGTGSVEQLKYLKDGKGNVRKYMMRRAAAADAHTKDGEVVKQGNFYVVKLRENNDVHIYNESIQEERRTKTLHMPTENFRSATTRSSSGSARSTGLSESSNRRTDCGGSADSRKKISFGQTKKKFEEKLNESIDQGIEPGMALSGWNKEVIAKDGKAKPKLKVNELTGDETTASIGDQKEDELAKQGISLKSFKKRNYV
jgi:predicted ABC-type ATPase